MSDPTNATDQPASEVYPATVVRVLDEGFQVVMNRGLDHGVKQGMRFLVYGLSKEEIRDPETNESLGVLEIVRGTGKAVHVQAKLTTLRSDRQIKRFGRVVTKSTRGGLFSAIVVSPMEETTTEPAPPEELPFDDVQEGKDKARPI